MGLGPEWDTFDQDGHTFVKAVSAEVWACVRCGATKDRNNYTGLPDDSWSTIVVGGRELWVDSCEEGQELMVQEILDS